MTNRLKDLNEILDALKQGIAQLETARQEINAEEKRVRQYIPSHGTEIILTLLKHDQKENAYLRAEIEKRIDATNNLIAVEEILRKYGATSD